MGVEYTKRGIMRILDATCGQRLMWYDRHDPRAVYVDLRPEVYPDLICDCTRSPFRGKCFDLIVFDPPHCNIGRTADMAIRYGHFTHVDIKWLLLRAFHEFARILKDDGLVLFKWATRGIKLETALALSGEEFLPLFGQLVSTRVKHPSMTYWVTLVKTKNKLKEVEIG